MIRFIFIFIFISIFATKGITQSWEIVTTSSMPEPVTNNALTEGFIDGVPFVYSFGGLDATKRPSGIHQRAYRYNVTTDIWEMIPSLPDTLGKIGMAANSIDSIIYIIGGYHVLDDGQEFSSNKVHRFDIKSNSFLSDGNPLPIPVDDHVQCVWRDSLIFVITGWSHETNIPNVQIYNPAKDSWIQGTPTPDNINYTSFGASGVILGDTIFYFGGASSNKNFPIQNNLRIGVINKNDPAKITWSDTTLDPQIQGYRMGATSVNNKVFWMGGSGITYNFDGESYHNNSAVAPLNRILCYIPHSGEWYPSFVSTLPMDIRGVANISETIKYIAGGMLSGRTVSSKTFRLIWNNN